MLRHLFLCIPLAIFGTAYWGGVAQAANVIKADPAKKQLVLRLTRKEAKLLGTAKDLQVVLPNGGAKLAATVKTLKGFRLTLQTAQSDWPALTAKNKVTLELSSPANGKLATTGHDPAAAGTGEETSSTNTTPTTDPNASATLTGKKGDKPAKTNAFDNPLLSPFHAGHTQLYQTKRPTIDGGFAYLSTSTSAETETEGNYDDTKGQAIALRYSLPLTSKPELAFAFGLTYMKLDDKIEYEDANGSISNNIQQSLIALPLQASFAFLGNMAVSAEVSLTQVKLSGDVQESKTVTYVPLSLGYTFFTPRSEVTTQYHLANKKSDVRIPAKLESQGQFKIGNSFNLIGGLSYNFNKGVRDERKDNMNVLLGGEFIVPALLKVSAALTYETASEASATTATPTSLPNMGLIAGLEWWGAKNLNLGTSFQYVKGSGKRKATASTSGDADLTKQETAITLYTAYHF